MSFWCLQIDQKSNEIFVRISALASKKRLDQKKYSLLYCFFNHLIRGFFLITPLCRFLVDLTQKENFEINWPLLKMNLFFFKFLSGQFIYMQGFSHKKDGSIQQLLSIPTFIQIWLVGRYLGHVTWWPIPYQLTLLVRGKKSLKAGPRVYFSSSQTVQCIRQLCCASLRRQQPSMLSRPRNKHTV